MILPYFLRPASALALVALAACLPRPASAQAAPESLGLAAILVSPRPHAVSLEATQQHGLLASLSAEAGAIFLPQGASIASVPPSLSVDPALCLRAALGVSAAVMSDPQVTVEHGIIGCHIETAGLPIAISRDPALTPPPASRTGEYTLSLTLRYRLLEQQHIQLIATVTDQALAYSIASPVTGNNLLATMSVLF